MHVFVPATLTDAAIGMFGALMGRAHLSARKRLEQRSAVSAREGRDRLMRVATALKRSAKQRVPVKISCGSTENHAARHAGCRCSDHPSHRGTS